MEEGSESLAVRPVLDVPLAGAARERLLTRAEFRQIAQVPAPLEFLANITCQATRVAYTGDIGEFTRFVGIERPEEYRAVARAHVIAWRKSLEGQGRSPASIRRKLSALSALYEHLCENGAADANPVLGVRRPREGTSEGKTPALGNEQAKRLLSAPPSDTLKGQRDRAILATLLYQGLRRGELCRLRVRDLAPRSGILHFAVLGKGGKLRYLPAHPLVANLITLYLDAVGHAGDPDGPLFRPVSRNTRNQRRGLSPGGLYQEVVGRWARRAGVHFAGLRPHSLRATAATNALEHGADISRVQEYLGHASISTTRLYDKRQAGPAESPAYRIQY